MVAPDQLLPTPTVGNAEGGNARRGGERGDELLLPGIAEAAGNGKLMPTPRAGDGEKGGPNQHGSSGDLMLPSAVDKLLPTPVAQPAGGSPENHLRKKPGREQVTDLGMVVENGLLESGGKLLPTPMAMEGYKASNSQNVDARAATGQVWLTNVIVSLREEGEGDDPQDALLDAAGHPLLPTPMTTDWKGSAPADGKRNGPQLRAVDQLLPTPLATDGHACTPGDLERNDLALRSVEHLLPTPLTTDAKGSGPADGNRDTTQLRAVDQLLPTPDAYAGTRGGSQDPEKRRAGGHSVSLGDVAEHAVNWGDYAPAIRRWERIMGPVPAPTEITARGKHRLAARFSEWMMGQPAGWITDPAIGISRNEQLKACGNGVVTAQAVAALTDMLAIWEEPGEGPVPVLAPMRVLPTTRAAQGETRNSNIWERDHSKTQNLENVLADVIAPGKVLPTPTTGDMREPDVKHQLSTRHTPGLDSITGVLGMPEETWVRTDLKRVQEKNRYGKNHR
jgi:hypothetical protein